MNFSHVCLYLFGFYINFHLELKILIFQILDGNSICQNHELTIKLCFENSLS